MRYDSSKLLSDMYSVSMSVMLRNAAARLPNAGLEVMYVLSSRFPFLRSPTLFPDDSHWQDSTPFSWCVLRTSAVRYRSEPEYGLNCHAQDMFAILRPFRSENGGWMMPFTLYRSCGIAMCHVRNNDFSCASFSSILQTLSISSVLSESQIVSVALLT